jgi:hypothetical protein
MQKYTDVVTSARSGSAIPSASVTVKTSPGGVTATIYSDDGVTTQANPLTTDSNGEFTFYAADGEYTLTVSGTGITERTVGPIILHDPADSDDYMPSTDVSFTQSGSGAVAETVSAALQRFVHTAQYSTQGNYETARDALTGTIGVPSLEVTGSLTVGNASADVLTVNAGTWTIGNNVTATRASGTVAAGSSDVVKYENTFTGDSGGTSDVSGLRITQVSDGANAVSQSVAARVTAQHTGSGLVTTFRGLLAECRLDGANNVDTAMPLSTSFVLTSTGDIATNVQMFRVSAPTITGAGTIPAIDGIRISNQGHANVTNVVAIRIQDQTGSTTHAGIRSEISSGTDKYNIYIAGTAANFFQGITGIGTGPSASAALNLPAGTTSVASLRIAHGSAPTSPVNGDIWTTTAGLFVRINGSTVGPLS